MKSLKTRRIVGVISLIIAVIVAVVTITWFINEFNQMVYDERAYHLEETSAQLTKTVDAMIDEHWNLLSMVSIRYSTFDSFDTEDCIESISKLEERLKNKNLIFGIVDKNGKVYTSHETKFNLNSLVLSDEKRQLTITNKVGDNDTYYMTFLAKNDEAVVLADGNVITHTILYVNLAEYSNVFHNDAYANENVVCIRDEKGKNIYTEKSKFEFFDSLNYEEIASHVKRKNGHTLEEIVERVGNKQSTVTSLSILNEEGIYFLVVQPMETNNWNLVMIIPEQFASAQTIDFAGAIVDTAILIGVLLAGLTLGIYIYLVKNRNAKALIEQEREYSKALAASAEEAKNANMAKTKFLSHMSHDIRTPINGILGMISKAERHIGEPEVIKDCHKKIRMSAEHLLGLINDILDITKLETGLNEEKDEPFPMSCMLDTCCSIIKGQLSEKGTVEFKTDFSGIQHDNVLGNKLHIRQILLNILSNAVKYTDNGYIYFKAEEIAFTNDEATYAFTIQDTGIGMHKNYIEKIFEPFSIDDSEDRKYRLGTGLGMSIVKNNVDRLGGTISVDSTLGLGSTFTVTFTLKLTDLEVVCEAAKERVNKNSADVSGMKVLLVEDNELNIEVALMLLEDAGVSADVAKNGKEAVDKFLASKEGDYDLILMDVMMPVMNGYEATMTIRNSVHPLATTIPIIAQTANAFQDDIKKVKEAGMNAHISKPIEEENLLKILAQYKK
ncbi:MAG: response regulator [Ruminococcaceae bacterium]|nr:response regulator [Oscillospiraceae bacterium]